jgi:hypothetical protein
MNSRSSLHLHIMKRSKLFSHSVVMIVQYHPLHLHVTFHKVFVWRVEKLICDDRSIVICTNDFSINVNSVESLDLNTLLNKCSHILVL